MKLKLSEKLGYGLGAIGKDMVYALVATFYLKFATDVLGVAPAFMGLLFFIARIWDAFNDPIMGAIVDNTKTRWGKFRPWIFLGTLLNAVVLIALFYVPSFKPPALMLWASITYILWGMTYTIMDIPYWSLIPALSEDEKERNVISTIPRIFAAVGNLAANVFSLSMIAKLGRGDEARGYLAWATAVAGIFLISSLITTVFVKEKLVVVQENSFSFKKLFRTLFSNDQLLVIVGSMVFFQTTIYLTTSLALYWFEYDLGNRDLFSLFALIAGAGQVLAMALFPLIAGKMGRHGVFRLAVVFGIAGYVLLFLAGIIFGENILPLGIAGLIVFMGLGASNVLTSVMLADAVDYGEYKLGHRNESLIFSMQTFLVKFASALSGLIAGIGLTLIGYQPSMAQTAKTLVGLRILMFAVPPIFLIAAAVVYQFFFRLNSKTMQNIRQELHIRRQKGLDKSINQ